MSTKPDRIEIAPASLGPLALAPIADSDMARSFHLLADRNTSLDLETVWADYRGDGITVGVIDSGIEITHSELAANYRTDLDYDLAFDTAAYDPARHGALNPHGTMVAGVIAADDNGTLSVGIAPDVELVGFAIDYDAGNAVAQLLAGVARAASVDVVNGSWGFVGAFSDNFAHHADMAQALQTPVATGRGGLGTVVVLAGGNSRGSDTSNYHHFQNSPLAIAVGAVDKFGGVSSFSSPGFNLLVSAPGTGVFTTTLAGGSGNASGTSFAAPVVSGVVALMLEANPTLGYRDVQQILAHAARQITSTRLASPEDYTGWQTTGATDHNGGGGHYSPDYGFGYVNAHDAVRLAESWSGQRTLANRAELSVTQTTDARMVAGQTDHLQIAVAVTQDLAIEHVQVTLDFDFRNAADLEVYLTSPLGFTSQLAFDLATDTAGLSLDGFALTSVAHLGERAQGDWTLDIFNRDPGATDVLGLPVAADLTAVTLDFFGSLPSADDTYVYTDELGTLYAGAELAARLTLDDADGGIDTLNAAAVTTDLRIDLGAGAVSVVAGQTLTLGTGVIEHAQGGDGADTMTGNAADNRLSGGRGDDRFTATAGQDSLDGGAGQDTLVLGAAAQDVTAELTGGDGAVLRFADGSATAVTGIERFDFADVSTDLAGLADLPRAPSAPVGAGPTEPATTRTVIGADSRDRVFGTAEAERIEGRGGADALYGRGGADLLLGGADRDNLLGGEGDDWLVGGDAVDVLRGEAGADLLIGGAGADKLFGGAGADRFVFTLADVAACDTIYDFRAAEGDCLDLGGLSDTLGAQDLSLRSAKGVTVLFATLDGISHDLARLRGSDLPGQSLQSLIDADVLILA